MHFLFKQYVRNHEITVYDTNELYGEKGNFRVLQFSDAAVQGAMDLHNPGRVMFEYPRAIIHLMEFNNPDFEDAFLIGHGIGTIAGHFAKKRFKVAELNETVVELSRAFFGYDAENVVIGDGRLILEGEREQAYDYIILDAFTDKGTPRHLTSKSFFGMVRQKLESGGAFIMNLMGRGDNDSLINAIHTTLSEEFAYIKTFLLPSGETGDMKNMIMIGRSKPIGFQARQMAGFVEFAPRPGHIITD
ncbi:spermidine synthase [Paenibacillus contaminans]|uniref:Spermidine synthase n=1 Tax=Paenibacillus contaminans TaxID=450362 RepID=A0A329MQU0_9BACL|nr:fused MFS/spermidine synthase [Paenibacillus contaminans]RAV20307.1 spermidine synthase [Paenibacillus contaminans]